MSTTTDSSIFRVTVVGASGHGRQEVLQGICHAHGIAAIPHTVGDLTVWECELSVVDDVGNASIVRMRALDDACPYALGQDLLLKESDAVIFVFDVRHPHLEAGWYALQQVAESAQRSGYDLRSRPLVLQYHRCDAHPGFEPAKMDGWLGLPPGGEVARVVTSTRCPDGDGAVFKALCRQADARRLVG